MVDSPSSEPSSRSPARSAWIAVFALALALRLAIAVSRPADPAAVLTELNDSTDYDLLARNILAGLGYVGLGGEPSVIRPPFYPAFMAVVYAVAGESNLRAVMIAQAVVGAVGSLLTMWVARLLGARGWWPAVAGLADACYPVFVFQSGLVLTEATHRPLFMAGLGALLVALRQRGLQWWLVAGALLGVATLSRPVVLALVPLVLALGLWRGRGPLTARAVRCGALACTFTLLVAPWTLRNWAVSGRVVPVAANMPAAMAHGSSNYSVHAVRWFGNGPEVPLLRYDRSLLWHTQLRAFNGAAEELAQQDRYRADVARLWRGERAFAIRLSLARAVQFWSPAIQNPSRMARLAAVATMAPALVLGWVGVGLLLRRPGVRRTGGVLCLAVALMATAPHALSMPDVRYRSALVDALWIAAAATIAGTIRRRRCS